ncbi:transmembrane protein, putative [Medicago truncatula]|uniref:Transmembrane protein, putative n=1 Tax=Medicago truncatula TaxID=3880 RepID=A0A072VNB7_MEDTR|nr:transmembrane protein, putative [Medicago truncatula]
MMMYVGNIRTVVLEFLYCRRKRKVTPLKAIHFYSVFGPLGASRVIAASTLLNLSEFGFGLDLSNTALMKRGVDEFYLPRSHT